MKSALKIILYSGFFLAALVWLTPKANLYYALEHQLKPLDIVISDETVEDRGMTFALKEAKVFVKGIESAAIGETSLAVFGAYNRLCIEKVRIDDAMAAMMPQKIDRIAVRHSLINPLVLTVRAEGEFGNADGEVDLLERKLVVNLYPSKLMQTRYTSSLRQLKPMKEGGYQYATSF